MNLRFHCAGYIGWFYLRAMKYIELKCIKVFISFAYYSNQLYFMFWSPDDRYPLTVLVFFALTGTLGVALYKTYLSNTGCCLVLTDVTYLPSIFFNFVVCFCCAGIPTFSGNTYPDWCNFILPEDHAFFNYVVLHRFTTVSWYADSRLAIPVSPQNS